MMESYPHCKICKNIVTYQEFGSIDCKVWGACLGYNNAAECPFYEKDDEKSTN